VLACCSILEGCWIVCVPKYVVVSRDIGLGDLVYYTMRFGLDVNTGEAFALSYMSSSGQNRGTVA
jgi:hypothetical protein